LDGKEMKGKRSGKEEQTKCSFLGLLLWLGRKGLGRACFYTLGNCDRRKYLF